MRNYFYISVVLLIAITGTLITYSPWFLLILIFAVPYTLIGFYDCFQKQNNVTRNFPVVGHIKQLFKENRELLQDWILENEQDVRPFDLIQRNIVVDRSENGQQTVAFGTRYNYYESGYEWMLHSINPSGEIKNDLRVIVGCNDCKKPYSSSILNVSGMSYGSISKNATMALNGAAKLGSFASNTGEGGLTQYHLHYGGDLIFQFGTGYFGCRTIDEKFDEVEFSRKAKIPQVKMIEIKISQGAKPGYGAILPGKKINQEIADIRGIKPGVTIISPAAHSAFSTPVELLFFIRKLRELSEGKPVGIKLCLGKPHEIIALSKAMLQTGILMDFITIDGAEGGTGAGHFESVNWVGMPLEDSIAIVHNVLNGFGLRKQIKLFVAGKIISAFHIIRALALGADACYSARGMMFALGCVQALQCDRNTCPTGITTTKKTLVDGLVPEIKEKVYNYHRNTMKAVKDMMVAAGLSGVDEINRSLICRRTGFNSVKTLEEIFPAITEGSLLNKPYPEGFDRLMKISDANSFAEQVA